MASAKVTKTYNRIIKTMIVLAAGYFLYHQLFLKNTVEQLSFAFSELISRQRFILFLILVLLLMPINWMLEALKWKQIVSAKEKISLGTAMKAVFAGTTISAISINRTGEFLGRIFVLKNYTFWEGAIVTVVGSYAQTFNTFFWGILSAFLLLLPYSSQLNIVNSTVFYMISLAVILGILFFLFLYYKISWANKLVNEKHKKIRKTIEVLRLVDNYTLNKVLVLSTLRYFVFSTQFFLLLMGSSVEISAMDAMMLISVMFLFNTIRPSIALLEIGLRSASALYVFELYYITIQGQAWYPEIEIAATTSFIWLINIVIPSIIGMAFIKDLRFFKKENKDKF